MKTKACTKCGGKKPLDQFAKRSKSPDGLQNKCKSCFKKYKQENREWIQERNKEYNESHAEESAAYRKRNKKKILENAKRYRSENKEIIAEKKKAEYQENKPIHVAKRKKYREENKELVKKQKAASYKRNQKSIKAKRSTDSYKQRAAEVMKDYRKRNPGLWGKYSGHRYDSDENFKLAKLLRSRMRFAINNNQKKGSAVKDLGCSIEELWQHFESQFTNGMTRENLGEVWHIDHIFPLAEVDLTNRVEFLAAANWRNLQPLEVEENLRKSDQVTPEAQRLFNKLKKEFEKEK